MNIENGMVIDDLPFTSPGESGICPGCDEAVLEYEEKLEYEDEILHNDSLCLANYMRKVGVMK